MKKLLFIAFVSGVIISCTKTNTINSQVAKSDKIYQYSIFTALANKIYDGSLTVAGVKQKGNTGLGTFNGLDGEMIVSEGVVYKWNADGEISIPDDTCHVPFTVVSFFEEDKKLNIASVKSYDEMKSLIKESLPSENKAYTFVIHADFTTLKCGSAPKQQKPYSKTLSQALVNRPTFTTENIRGKMVGFYYPKYIGKINVPGFHLHFISDDKKHAGHIMEFSAKNLEVGIDASNGFDIELIESKAFKNAVFDLSQEYNTKK